MGSEGCLLLIVAGVVVLFIRSFNIRRDLEMHVENLKREIADLRAAVAAPKRESAAERVEAMKKPPVAPVPRVVETPPPSAVPPASPVPPATPVPPAPVAPSRAPAYAAAIRVDLPSLSVAPAPAAPSGPSLQDR